MRLILASLTLLLALLLGGLLLLPRLVEDEAARAMLDRIATAQTGYPLEVGGAIEFSLLPRPTLSFARARLGDGETGTAPFAARFDRVDIELAIGPLLRGRLELARMRLVRPVLEIRSTPDEALRALLGAGPAAEHRLLVRNLEILDGTVAFLRAAPGRPVQLSGIDALLTDTAGGFVVEGRGRTLKAPVVFRLEASVPQRGGAARIAFRGQLGTGGELAKLRYDGSLTAREDGLGGQGEFEFVSAEPAAFVEAVAALLDRLPPALPPLPRPVRLRGNLEKGKEEWVFGDLALELAGRQLAGGMRLRPGPRLRLDASFEANRLDLPLTAEELDLWRRRMPPPPYGFEARLALRIGALDWGGKPVRQFRLDARVDDAGALLVERLTARIPGGGDLRLGGTLASVAGKPRWLGDIALSGQSLRETLAWLGVSLPDNLESTALSGYALQGRLRLGADGVSLRDGEIRVDGTSARGSFALLFGERPQLAVAATVDRLPVDDYLGLLPANWDVEVLRRRAASFDAALDLTLERLTLGSLRARTVTLRAGLEKGRLTVGEMRLADLGGASAGIAGTFALDSLDYDFAADVEVPSAARLARLAGLPGYELLA
ncbi:MAG TPA: AsmA family protein, partial [Rhodospirillales bacterium]|nr:AsmA family protein [Rhodospirillales bacterium]